MIKHFFCFFLLKNLVSTYISNVKPPNKDIKSEYSREKILSIVKKNPPTKKIKSEFSIRKIFAIVKKNPKITFIITTGGVVIYILNRSRKNRKKSQFIQPFKKSIEDLNVKVNKNKEIYNKIQPLKAHQKIYDAIFNNYITANNNFDKYMEELKTFKKNLKILKEDEIPLQLENLNGTIENFLNGFQQKEKVYRNAIKIKDKERIQNKKQFTEVIDKILRSGPLKYYDSALNRILSKNFLKQYKKEINYKTLKNLQKQIQRQHAYIESQKKNIKDNLTAIGIAEAMKDLLSGKVQNLYEKIKNTKYQNTFDLLRI
jgi:hypothetical protein